ncbi:antiviral reverse transcriptase Drt3a [uncultured Maribacter sp.]|uniref:antiviral reverse transcriptase Drt3a n=1 Tax=uncultured Maribacter sp. TaxID=431308 RepID=UPI0026049F97|nr:antiviral reverse transcriptase Drt3a [uncultured Maribacter sp.]
MLDQSFSQDTFQEIFDRENRKGKNIESKFKTEFQPSLDQLNIIQTKTAEIIAETDVDRKKVLFEERKRLKQEREVLIKNILNEASTNLPSKIQNLKVDLGPMIGKQTYVLEEKLENFFISKKTQWNIARTYKVKQANRYAILSQLTKLLEDQFPKYIIRTDIQSFYESIPQKHLLLKINNDHLLSVLSKRFINKVIEEFNVLTSQTGASNPIGVPRGIGISPYLSELYMRIVDNEIKDMPNLIYYSRYVDDILAIFVPETKKVTSTELARYKTKLIQIIKNKGLNINSSKTESYNLINGIDSINTRNIELLDNIIMSKRKKTNATTINYLGYTIGSLKTVNKFSESSRKDKTTRTLTIDISDKKISKYKAKIKSAFDDFQKKRTNNEKNAFKLLKARIEFLASNTRLRNNKANVLIGIYYSNPFINNSYSLEILDNYFKWHRNHGKLSAKQKSQLEKLNFKNGYKTKKFVLFPLKKELYRNHNSKKNDVVNINNKGVLRYGLREINSIWKKF